MYIMIVKAFDKQALIDHVHYCQSDYRPCTA